MGKLAQVPNWKTMYFSRIGVYKWDIRPTKVKNHEGLLVFFNRTRYLKITTTKDSVIQVQEREVVLKFDLRTLCSSTQGGGGNKTDLFTREDLSLAEFSQDIKDILGRQVSDYIGNNYSFDLDASCKPGSPMVVIILPIYGKVMPEEVILNKLSNEVLRMGLISTNMNIPVYSIEHFYCNKMGTEYEVVVTSSCWADLELKDWLYSKLVRVPPLEIFEQIDGRLMAEDTCSICWEEFIGKDIPDRMGHIIRKTRCTHYFHRGCIGRWVGRKLSCPSCRSLLSGSPPSEPTICCNF